MISGPMPATSPMVTRSRGSGVILFDFSNVISVRRKEKPYAFSYPEVNLLTRAIPKRWLVATPAERHINMVFQQQIELRTSRHGEMRNLTDQVTALVKKSGVRTGVAHVFCVGSTAAVGAIEFEPGLQRDLPETLDLLIPPSRNYGHEQTWHDGNGHSHLQATLLGPSLTVPVTDGNPVLGTWQQIIHLECDIRPRERTVVVTVLGDPGG
jgi:secondary thiamine-phosphate synthase enzyme